MKVSSTPPNLQFLSTFPSTLLGALILAIFIAGYPPVASSSVDKGGDAECLQHCDKHRSRYNSEGYLLNCSKKFGSDPSALSGCRRACDRCPDSICNAKVNPDLYHCPPPEGSLYQEWWFILTLCLVFPGLILLTILVWTCVSTSRTGHCGGTRHQLGTTYQEQLPQDPYNFMDGERLAGDSEEPSASNVLSNLSSGSVLEKEGEGDSASVLTGNKK